MADVYKYYGTFSRSMMSMFEITVGNWVPICRSLFENVGEPLGWFSLCSIIVVNFAVVKIITGVFLATTFKVASEGVITLDEF